MRLTPHKLMNLLRAGAVLAGVCGFVSLSWPMRYADLGLPFPDTVAHAILFYGLTLVVTGALPRSRAFDVAMAFVALGVASELAQSVVGREVSFHDFFGDVIGIAAAYTPVAVGRFRELVRTHPDMTFAELRRIDRRRTSPFRRTPALSLETIA